MSDRTCELCGKKLTAWNTAWGTGKCDRCATGRSSEAKKAMDLKGLSNEGLRQLALAQKIVIVSIIAWLLAFVLIVAASASLSVDYTGLILPFTASQMIAIYGLAKAMKRPSPAVWVFGTLFPFVGLILLLILNQKASHALESAGLRVGPFGVNLSDVRHVQASEREILTEQRLRNLAAGRQASSITEEQYDPRKREIT